MTNYVEHIKVKGERNLSFFNPFIEMMINIEKAIFRREHSAQVLIHYTHFQKKKKGSQSFPIHIDFTLSIRSENFCSFKGVEKAKALMH